MAPGQYDSGLSSWSSLSQEIQLITQSLSPHLQNFSDESYLDFVIEKVNEDRKKFFENYSLIQQEIEEFSQRLSFYSQTRVMEIKRDLQKIAQEKASKWSSLLQGCEKAKALRRSFMQAPFDLSCIKTLEMNYKEIADHPFVEQGKIEFNTGNMSAYEDVLQSLGRISFSNSSVKDEVLTPNILPKFIIGSAGSDSGQFCRPWGVCTDPTGRILISDRSNHRIQIFDALGQFILKFGKEGSNHGEFSRPAGVTVDNSCRIIVADKDNHRIQVFSYSGGFLFAFGSQGSKIGEFIYPWDVATNQNCDIAVSDSKNHRVQLFNHRGIFLTKLHYDSTRIGLRQLDCPRGLTFLPNGDLLLTDFNNHRILKVDKNFKKVMCFGQEGNDLKEFFRPQGITCDKKGRFAVADSKNYRIQIFDMSGNLYKVFGTKGDRPGEFDCPQGIAFHPNGSLIVVDLSNNRVQVF